MKPKGFSVELSWAATAILAIAIVMLVTCCKPEAEDSPTRFELKDLSRFTMTRDPTATSMPDLFLIKDSMTGREFLAVGCAARGMAVIEIQPKPKD